MAEAFGSLLPQRADGLRVLEAKMLLVLSGGGGGSSLGFVYTGASTPEGNVTAPVGSIYNQIVNGVAVASFTKVSGSGKTGWQ